MSWESRKILIYGKTYPEISSRYVETVCTGGILDSDCSFIRLYPIPFRYLEEGRQFKLYQWIRADIKKHIRDNRPESYEVRLESIQPLEVIGTGNNRDWEERKRLFLQPKNIFRSLEVLRTKQNENKTSIGMIKPKRIIDFYVKNKTQQEYEAAIQKRDQKLNQDDMFRTLLDHEIPKIKFYFKFECDDPSCNGHDISVLDWGFYELYRKTRSQHDWFEKMRQKVMECCNDKHETYFFMGNLAHPTKRNTFCVSGLFFPPIMNQLPLL